nr:uncharacterized protein LOC129143285 [Pan troglodytes]
MSEQDDGTDRRVLQASNPKEVNRWRKDHDVSLPECLPCQRVVGLESCDSPDAFCRPQGKIDAKRGPPSYSPPQKMGWLTAGSAEDRCELEALNKELSISILEASVTASSAREDERQIPGSFGRMTMLQKSTWICSFVDITCEGDSSLLSMEESEARLTEEKKQPSEIKIRQLYPVWLPQSGKTRTLAELAAVLTSLISRREVIFRSCIWYSCADSALPAIPPRN